MILKVSLLFTFTIESVFGLKSNDVWDCEYAPNRSWYDFENAAKAQINHYQTSGRNVEHHSGNELWNDWITARFGYRFIEGYVPFNNGIKPGNSAKRVVIEVNTQPPYNCKSVYYTNTHYGDNGAPAFYGPCKCP